MSNANLLGSELKHGLSWHDELFFFDGVFGVGEDCLLGIEIVHGLFVWGDGGSFFAAS